MTPETITTDSGEQNTPAPRLVTRAAGALREGITGPAATALAAGSAILLTKGWGLIAPNSPTWERVGYIAAGGYVLVHGAATVDLGASGPFIGPGAAVLWCTAAWTVAPSPDQTAAPDEEAEHEHEEKQMLPGPEEVAALARKVAGGTQGAHLEDLLATGQFGSLPKAELKALLTDIYRLPVESFGIRVNGRKRTRDGVRLRHLPPPPPEPAPSTPA